LKGKSVIFTNPFLSLRISIYWAVFMVLRATCRFPGPAEAKQPQMMTFTGHACL